MAITSPGRRRRRCRRATGCGRRRARARRGCVSNGAPVSAAPDGVGLVGAADEEPDLARALEALAGQGHPGGRRLGGVVHRHAGAPVVAAAGWWGKSEATWPSGPTPSTMTSNRSAAGRGAGRRCRPRRSPRRERAGSGTGAPRCTCSGSSPRPASPAASFWVSLRSGSPAGSQRSSPHQTWTCDQSTASRAGTRAQRLDDRGAHRAAGEDTWATPRADWASTSATTSRAAAASARACRPRCTTTVARFRS